MAVAYDQSATGGGNGVNLYTITMSTAGTNRLLIFNGHETQDASVITSITGGGLTWVKITDQFLGTDQGNVEVWRTFAASQLTSEVFTVTFVGVNYPQASGVISAYSGTDTTGTSGSGAIGSVVITEPETNTTPEASLNTLRANSLVIGAVSVVDDPDVTADTNQTSNGQYKSAGGVSTSAQIRRNAVQVVAQRGVGIFTTIPTSALWCVIAIEIKEAGTDADDTWAFDMGTEAFSKYSQTGQNLTQLNAAFDVMVAKGLETVRMDMVEYQDTTWLADSKTATLSAMGKGLNTIWGVCSANLYGHPERIMTKENWAAYVTAVESAATWAQANSIYEFSVGNEAELHIFYEIPAANLVRTSNVVTVTTSFAHVFTTANQVTITGATPSDLNGTFTISNVTATTFDYTAAGVNGASSTAARAQNLTAIEVRENILDLVTTVKSIYTNGKVSYTASVGSGFYYYRWGKRDLDILGMNLYQGGPPWTEYWKTAIADALAILGSGNFYVTEFNLSWDGFPSYTTQNIYHIASDLYDMAEYIRASGVRRALYFAWNLEEYKCYDVNSATLNKNYYAVFERLLTTPYSSSNLTLMGVG